MNWRKTQRLPNKFLAVFLTLSSKSVQFSEFESEKEITVVGVLGGAGRCWGGGLERGQLTQQVQAAAGAVGHAAGPLGDPPLLDGANGTGTGDSEARAPALDQTLEPLPLLGFLGSVSDVAHPALAPGRRPPDQRLVRRLRLLGPALGGEVARGQRLHVGQPAQLLRQVARRTGFGRPAAPAELVSGRPDDEAAADAAVLAVEVAGDVVRGQIPEALGHG